MEKNHKLPNFYFKNFDNKNIDCMAFSIKGNFRNSNQDTLTVLIKPSGPMFFGIFDGMGGHYYGDVASQFVRDYVADKFNLNDFTNFSSRQIYNWCRQILKKAQQELALYGAAHPEYRDMGTTATVLFIFDNIGYWCHVGDTRLYWKQGDILVQVSQDQNLLNDNRDLFMKSQKKNIQQWLLKYNYWVLMQLTSCMGPEKPMHLEFGSLKVNRGDMFFLTTDGLHDFLSRKQMLNLANNHKKLATLAKRMLSNAENNNSHDNISAVLIRIKRLNK